MDHPVEVEPLDSSDLQDSIASDASATVFESPATLIALPTRITSSIESVPLNATPAATEPTANTTGVAMEVEADMGGVVVPETLTQPSNDVGQPSLEVSENSSVSNAVSVPEKDYDDDNQPLASNFTLPSMSTAAPEPSVEVRAATAYATGVPSDSMTMVAPVAMETVPAVIAHVESQQAPATSVSEQVLDPAVPSLPTETTMPAMTSSSEPLAQVVEPTTIVDHAQHELVSASPHRTTDTTLEASPSQLAEAALSTSEVANPLTVPSTSTNPQSSAPTQSVEPTVVKDEFGRDVTLRVRSPSPPAPPAPAPAPVQSTSAPTHREPGIPPLNSRIFVGNLACERTSEAELRQIFGKYGQVLEVSMHASFGFVQFESAESAQAAINGENQKMFAGLKLDINVATNRGDRRPKRRAPDRFERPPTRRRDPSPAPRHTRGYDAGPPPAKREAVMPPVVRPSVPDCVLVIWGTAPATREFTDTVGKALADVGMHVDSLAFKPSLDFQGLMEDMRADGVKVVCVVPDASGVRSTLDAHRMQGEHQVEKALYLAEALRVIELWWKNPPAAPAVMDRRPAAPAYPAAPTYQNPPARERYEERPMAQPPRQRDYRQRSPPAREAYAAQPYDANYGSSSAPARTAQLTSQIRSLIGDEQRASSQSSYQQPSGYEPSARDPRRDPRRQAPQGVVDPNSIPDEAVKNVLDLLTSSGLLH